MIAEALGCRGAINVLAYICEHPGCTCSDVCNNLDFPSGNHTVLDRTERLVKAGLVEKGDGKVMHGSKFLTATPKGRRIIEVLREVESQ